MNIVFVLLLVVSLANLALAGFVLWHNIRVEANQVFALTAMSAGGWAMTNALFQFSNSTGLVTLAAQLSYLSAIILGSSFLHFSWIFPLRRTNHLRSRQVLWLLAMATGLLPFVPGSVIHAVNLSAHRSIETTSGVYLIALFMIVTTLWAFGTFVWHHGSLHRVAREQSRWVLSGSALTAVIGLICNLFLPLFHNYSLVWVGPVSTLFFVGFSIYAIVAHHLFDIRIIIKRTLVYSLLVAAIGVGYSGVEHILTEAIKGATANTDYAWIASAGGALVVSIFAAPLKKWLEKQLGRIIYHQGEKERTRQTTSRSKSDTKIIDMS